MRRGAPVLLSLPLQEAIIETRRRLIKEQIHFAVGGSCGLLLQGVEIAREPRDLDIYIDNQDAERAFGSLQPYAVDELHFSTSDIYESTLSHYDIGGVKVELVAGFRVKALNSNYRVDISFQRQHCPFTLNFEGSSLAVMPLAHEFLFNLLRNREDRYLAIAAKMRSLPSVYLTALTLIMAQNVWGIEVQKKIAILLEMNQETFLND
jgi:hypothetical protein